MDWLLCDTDVVSYIIKKDTRADLYAKLLQNHLNCISFMTLAELRFWMTRGGMGAVRLVQAEKYLDDCVVLDSNQDMSKIWAEVTIAVEKQGRHISCADAWNAAVALYYNLPLVTHNRKDYEAVPKLKLISQNPK